MPKIFASAIAQLTPPTVHLFTGSVPLTTAAAYSLHPGRPHPPQLAPGKAARTASNFGSVVTWKTRLAHPSA